MNNSITGKYYDGQSSAANQATVAFPIPMTKLQVHVNEEDSFVWPLKDLKFEKYGSLLELRNIHHSDAVLQIDDADFSNLFFATMKQNKQVDIHTRLLSLGLAKITAIAVDLLGLIVFGYFYVLPPIAEKAATLIPESFDTEIGDAFMDSFLDENDIDKVKTKYLGQFAAQLDLKNKKQLHYSVVKSDQVNAFALPNGHIMVYTGILETMKSSEELVALLGHEASHVNHRHSIKLLCSNLAGYLAVSLLFSDVNGVMAVLADNAQQLQSLSYSRGFEQEADEQGLKILIDNHLNPKGMVRLFEQLEKESKFSVPKILSSHPLTKERKANMEKIIDQSEYQIKPNKQLENIFKKLRK